jgi:hypothetical protein
MTGHLPPGKDPSLRPFLRSMALELLVYTPIITIYLLLALRFGTSFLERLFHQSPVVYTIIGFAAMLTQGVLLDLLTSWLLRRFRLRR